MPRNINHHIYFTSFYQIFRCPVTTGGAHVHWNRWWRFPFGVAVYCQWTPLSRLPVITLRHLAALPRCPHVASLMRSTQVLAKTLTSTSKLKIHSVENIAANYTPPPPTYSWEGSPQKDSLRDMFLFLREYRHHHHNHHQAIFMYIAVWRPLPAISPVAHTRWHISTDLRGRERLFEECPHSAIVVYLGKALCCYPYRTRVTGVWFRFVKIYKNN